MADGTAVRTATGSSAGSETNSGTGIVSPGYTQPRTMPLARSSRHSSFDCTAGSRVIKASPRTTRAAVRIHFFPDIDLIVIDCRKTCFFPAAIINKLSPGDKTNPTIARITLFSNPNLQINALIKADQLSTEALTASANFLPSLTPAARSSSMGAPANSWPSNFSQRIGLMRSS
jgi:hypothetical protein